MKKIVVLLLIVISSLSVLGQNYVGAHKLTIKKEMKQNYRDFYFSKEVLGKSSFIKFEDIDGYRTLLFVLNEDGYCKYQILMCDYGLLRSTIDSLNKNFEYQKDLTWYDYISGKDNYVIRLKKEEWYFSVVTRKLEKD
ncbi:MAG: hypothetical protein V2I54_00705 [Bacteroidales bacterium]|jgi:hypothetical protein|nr:hypothetical protein [Bacteroidales bacterium]